MILSNFSNKNPVISCLATLLLGPLGFLYIGFNFFIGAMLVSILFNIVLAIINLPIPEIFKYIQLIVYGYFGYIIATTRNAISNDLYTSEDEIKEFKSFGFSIFIMNGLMMRMAQIYGVVTGLYMTYMSFSNGKIFLGMMMLIFGIGVIIWFVSFIFSIVSVLLVSIFKLDSKYL